MKKNLNKSFRYELIFIILFISSILINFNSSIKEKDSIKSFSVNFHNTDLKINKNQTLGKANKIQWFARIFDDNIYLYKTPNNTVSDNIYFVLQPTYFVELLEEANSTFYKAKYLDIEGYVKKNEVQVVATPPRTPYANNINFRIFNNSSQIMRTIPSASGGNSTQVCFLPLFSQDAQFYGYIEGESAIPQRTNIWYFCKYTLDKTYYGYIYSDGCDLMTDIEENREECEYIDAPNFNVESEQKQISVIQKNERNYTLIIILISIPVAIFLVMFIKSGIILKANKKEKAKEVKLFFDS